MARSRLLLLLMLLNTSAASIEDFSLDVWCPDGAKRFDVRQFGAVGNGVGNDGKFASCSNVHGVHVIQIGLHVQSEGPMG